MKRENEDVRRMARAAGVPLWRIAAELNVSEPTLTRWMRVPLPEEKRDKIVKLIEREAANAV